MKIDTLLKSILFAVLYISILLSSAYALYYFTILLIDLGEFTQKSMNKVLFWALYLTVGFILLYFLYFCFISILRLILKKILTKTFADTKLTAWIGNNVVYFSAIYFAYLVWFSNEAKLSTFGVIASIVATIVGIHMFRSFDETTKNKFAELKYFENGALNRDKIFDELRKEFKNESN